MKIRQWLSQKKWILPTVAGILVLTVAALLHFGPVGRYAFASAQCETSPVAAQNALSAVPDSYKDTALLRKYTDALFYRQKNQFDQAIALFTELDYYRSSRLYVRELTYKKAVALREKGDFDGAAELFRQSQYEDYQAQADRTVYEKASSLKTAGNFGEAARLFGELSDFEDSSTRRLTCLTAKAEQAWDKGEYTVAATDMATVKAEDKGGVFKKEVADLYFRYAEVLISEEKWAEACEYLEQCDGHPEEETVKETLQYCSSMLTYLAAKDMMETEDYAGAVDLFDTIVGFLDADDLNAVCEYKAYSWDFKGWLSKDGTADTKTTSFSRSDTIYFYGTLTGGKPGRSIDLRFVWEDAMGATAASVVENWTDGTSGGVTFSYSVPKNANIGKSTIYVYNDKNDLLIDKFTFRIKK